MSGIMCVAASHTDAPSDVTKWYSLVNSIGGTLTTSSFSLAKNFIRTIGTSSYYPKIKYLLPMLGGNLAAARVPLIDVYNVGPATSSNFVDGDFSETTGLQSNGSSKRFKLGIHPHPEGTIPGGLGYWERNWTGGGTDSVVIGYQNETPDQRWMIDLRTSNTFAVWGSPANSAGSGTSGGNHHYYIQASSSADRKQYKNASQVASNTNNDTTPVDTTNSIFLMGYTTNLNNSYYYQGRCGVAYMTNGGLTTQEITDFHNAITTYLMSGSAKL